MDNKELMDLLRVDPEKLKPPTTEEKYQPLIEGQKQIIDKLDEMSSRQIQSDREQRAENIILIVIGIITIILTIVLK